jgi:hypothetical protein
MKIRPIGVELFREGEQRDMTKFLVRFHSSANGTKKPLFNTAKEYIFSLLWNWYKVQILQKNAIFLNVHTVTTEHCRQSLKFKNIKRFPHAVTDHEWIAESENKTRICLRLCVHEGQRRT